jgi:uncharacterized membrane protein
MAALMAAAMFPLLATIAKIQDRMAPDAPHTLDGMTYMQYATYSDGDARDMDLSQDYRAIRWMQDNVKGSPPIVEGFTTQYRWGARFSIYTGLPSVLGWEWHQIQQRAVHPNDQIITRREQIRAFYETEDASSAASFLQTYQVEYIILGQLERGYYPGVGLEKFDALDGDLWAAVFRDGDTVIYEVMDETLGIE